MSRIARTPDMTTVVSIGFVADLFYLDLISRYRCNAAIESKT